jgi:hypothetical protein
LIFSGAARVCAFSRACAAFGSTKENNRSNAYPLSLNVFVGG